MIIINPGQQEPPAGLMGLKKTPAQEAMASTAKAVSSAVVDVSCVVVQSATRVVVANACTSVPALAREVAVCGCAIGAKEIIKGLANKAIDSNICYGSEDSCISKTTTWIKDKF